jgi:dTDP-4-amino-4,6-dideoxygalactose transaminase
MKTIPFVDLSAQYQSIREETLEAMEKVLESGNYVLGEEVARLEDEIANYCGTRYAASVANGTDALTLTLKGLGIGAGDEVITVPNSFLASTSCIVLAGARPIFVDIRDDYNIDPSLIEAAITPRTKALVVVHLTGKPADMNPILSLAESYGLVVIEDAAQAFGARYHEKRVGSLGSAGCFSFHPLKNLNACGDGGIVTTHDKNIYDYIIKARNHGMKNRNDCEFFSVNSRLDAIQASLLRMKLRHIDQWIEKRRTIANFYREHMADVVEVPLEQPHEYAVYQTFIIRTQSRNDLQAFLTAHGIETRIHYTIPIHLQEAAKYLGYKQGDFPKTEEQAQQILSLPIYPELDRQQLNHIVENVRWFFEK